jgi:hypothetical protein
MPMFPDPTLAITPAYTTFSPLKANLEDMCTATEQLKSELDFFIDDAEAFGCLTEDTFLENAPAVLKLMQRISALLRNSTMDLTFEDELFEIPDASTICNVLFSFLGSHTAILSTLTATHRAIATTGPYAISLARSLSQQRGELERFKGALDMRDVAIKFTTQDYWASFEAALGQVLQGFEAEVKRAGEQDAAWEAEIERMRVERERMMNSIPQSGNGNDEVMMG